MACLGRCCWRLSLPGPTRESTYADNQAMKNAASQGRSPFPLNAQGRRPHLTITQSLEACFLHLGQALDLLAAAVVIVGGFEITNIAKIDWGDLEEIVDELRNRSTRQRYQQMGSTGRTAQEALIAPVSNWQQFGPTDWLPWKRDTRDGITHRAVGKKMMVMTTANRLARLLYRQPRWSELQSIIFGAQPPRKAFYDAFIMSASEDLLEGFCESVEELVEAVTKAMVVCWNARTADPQMIVQHSRQWPVVEPTEAMWSFPGYGTPIAVAAGSTVKMHPNDARRWRTARAMDDRRQDWYDGIWQDGLNGEFFLAGIVVQSWMRERRTPT